MIWLPADREELTLTVKTVEPGRSKARGTQLIKIRFEEVTIALYVVKFSYYRMLKQDGYLVDPPTYEDRGYLADFPDYPHPEWMIGRKMIAQVRITKLPDGRIYYALDFKEWTR